MKQITKVRKAVCVMANQLKKAGYTLSEAFKKAWRRGKLTMTMMEGGNGSIRRTHLGACGRSGVSCCRSVTSTSLNMRSVGMEPGRLTAPGRAARKSLR